MSKVPLTQAPPHDADLRWLFEDAQAAVGFSSSFDALCAMAQAGPKGSGSARSPDARMVRVVGTTEKGQAKAAGRLRALAQAWETLSPEAKRVLFAAYARHKVHQQHAQKLGHWPAVVMILTSVRRGYEAACERIQAAHAGKLHSTTSSVRHEQSVDEDGSVSVQQMTTTAAYFDGPAHAEAPSLLEWLTGSRGPRIDASALSCGVEAGAVGCCAKHDAGRAVLAAWEQWDRARVESLRGHGLKTFRQTPRKFVFRRDEE